MSTDFDMAPTPAAAPNQTAADGTPTSDPGQQTTRTRTVPVPAPEGVPVSDMKAFLVAGGPAVALIAGCYLLWAYGPWLLLGALILAAIAAATVIKAVAARARRSRSNHRAKTSPTRAGPAGTLRSPLLGGNRFGGASGRTGGTPRTGGGTSAGLKAAAVRNARRKSAMGGGTSAAPGRKTPGGDSTAAGGSTRADKTLAPGKNSPATKGPGGRTNTPSKGANRHTRTGLLARTLGKTMPGGRKTTPTAPTRGTTPKPAPAKPPTHKTPTKPNTPQQPTKKQNHKPTKKHPAPQPKKTPSGRRQVRVTPKIRKVLAQRAAALAKARRANAKTIPNTGPVRPKAAARLQRRVRRIATHRKIRAARAKTLRGVRRGARATNAVLSPLAARAFLRTGKALGWAKRRMTRLANSTSGPAWAPKFARGVAAGLSRVLNAGLWVSRRRAVSAWMLRHYATTGLGTPAAVAARAAKTILGPTRPAPTSPAGHTAKPGPAVTITAPNAPALTTTGATMASTNPEEIADAFEHFLATFEPESPSEFSAHFAAFAPMMESFCASMAKHAQRLQDEYGVKGGLVEMIAQFGSAFGGMCDMAEEVVQSWQSEHAEDIERTENPRPNEATTWNYNPGA